MRIPNFPTPPGLAVGTVVEHVNLFLARNDGADLRPRHRRDLDGRDYEPRSELGDYTILPCVMRPALGEAWSDENGTKLTD